MGLALASLIPISGMGALVMFTSATPGHLRALYVLAVVAVVFLSITDFLIWRELAR